MFDFLQNNQGNTWKEKKQDAIYYQFMPHIINCWSGILRISDLLYYSTSEYVYNSSLK